MAAFVHKPDFTPTPSLEASTTVGAATAVPDDATAVGIAVRAGADLPEGDVEAGRGSLRDRQGDGR